MKNMMLDTWDGQIWYPRFYDIDTILSYDNSGEIKFDVDIEMEQGYWNTSSSRLWTKVRDLMHDELVETYKQMRGNGVTYEQIMYYMYDEQIGKIPQTYYNKDFDIKYAPYADQYIGKAHGDGYEHMKRWLKRRFIFCDTLFDYAPSYNNDVLTIRANTLEEMNLTIETYTPLYQHVSFYNGNMEKIKITPGQPATFKGFAQTETDQEVLIYGGSNIKKITGIQSMNPNSMLIGGATRLTELDISNCPILTIVNSNKANFSPHTYLNKLNMSNCPQLGGNLNVSNSPLLQEIKARNSAVTGLLLPTSLRNLKTLELPNTISSLALYDAGVLENLKFDEGVAIQSIELSNCPGITNTENFDLTQTPTVILDNSYDTEELYMSETTNLTLRNMSNLERVIYTPNSEYSEFDINNVIGGKNYKVTTSSCPKLKTFMTTAPHRDSYNGDDVEYREEDKEITSIVELLTGDYVIGGNWDDSGNYSSSGARNETALIEDNTISYHLEVNNPSVANYIIRVNYFNNDTFISRVYNTLSNTSDSWITDLDVPNNCNKIIISHGSSSNNANISLTYSKTETVKYQVKDYGDITPNTVFTANTLDLSATQFTDIKLLCTTDVYNLKVPTTMKNFYCDSAFDIDTDVIEDASYEVIHEELIEPYTTNYEGEVLKYTDVVYDMLANWDTLPNGQSPTPSVGSTANDLIDTTVAELKTTDYIRVVPGTVATWRIEGDLSDDKFAEYDKDKKFIKSVGNANSSINANPSGASVTLSEETHYIRLSVKKCGSYISKIELSYKEVYTPNIIPSSANGSLIFNMYSNNTTQPTSTSPYMWDLTGLKLEDFYTYGMNNWVKGNSYVAQNSSEEKIYEAVEFTDNTIISEFDLSKMDTTIADFKQLLTVGLGDDITAWGGTGQKLHVHFHPSSSEIKFQAVDNSASTTYTTTYTDINIPLIIKVNKNGITYNDIDFTHNFDYDSDDYYQTMTAFKSATEITVYIGKDSSSINATYNLILNQNNIQSITMPQRMPGYSVRLVNADITPDEYPTMLYPKWIDTGLPITGKLDYTAYNGTSLAWAYAYTTGDVDINPLGSQHQGNITNDYNKLYGTDFVDIVDVWVYKDTDTSKLSTNEAITKAYIELTSANYKTRIDEVLQWYPNCTDLYFFEDGSVTTLENIFQPTSVFGDLTKGNNRLYWEQIQKITFMDGYFENVKNLTRGFQSLKNLQSIHIPNNVTSLYYAFEYCSNLQDINQLPNTLNDIRYTFANCSSLTQAPTIPQGVTNMQATFANCTSLTQAPTIPSSVTNMNETFRGCTSLTTPPAIPSGVTNMNSTFYGCTSLTTAPTIPSGVTNMQDTFYGCTSLTQAPTIPNSVTNMQSTFHGCTSLTQAPTIPSSCTNFITCFNNCTNLTSVPTDGWKGELDECFRMCTSLNQQINIDNATDLYGTFEGCTSLTITPTISSVTNCRMQNCFKNCTSLTTPPTIPQGVTNINSCFENCTALTTAPAIPEGVTQADALYRYCTSLTKAVLPIGNANCYLSLQGANNVTDIIFVGLRTTDYNISWITDSFTSSVICSNIQELVPEHLDDLHKDEIKISFSKKEITINNTETTWEEE